MAERTFTNQQGAVPCFICGEMIPGDMESTWDRSPAKRGKCHITCLAERNIAERNGAAKNGATEATENVAQTKPKPKPEASAGGWLDGLAEQLAPYIEDRISTKLDRDQVDGMVRDILKDAVMLTVTKVIVETKATGEIKDMGIQHKCFPDLLAICAAGENVWVTGPCGGGKTFGAEAVKNALGTRWFHIGAMDNEYKLMGFIDAQGRVVSTVFREWWENGGVICLDEVDSWLPAATLALNGALANGHCTFPDGMKPRHPDCIVIACANTWGFGATNDYVGRFKQDAAFVDRFVQMDWPYDESLELAISNNPAWVNRVQRLRRNAIAKGLKVIISPRASIKGANLLAHGMSQDKVEQVCLRRGMTNEQWESIQ